jgi:hypothetical protein
MKLKIAIYISYFTAGLIIPEVASASVGLYKCESYNAIDTRKFPKGVINSALLISKQNGYSLLLKLQGEFEIPLDSKLHLISDTKIPYTIEPLNILPNGKFSITILKRSDICTYSGKAKISPEAYKKLFKNRKSLEQDTTKIQSKCIKNYIETPLE